MNVQHLCLCAALLVGCGTKAAPSTESDATDIADVLQDTADEVSAPDVEQPQPMPLPALVSCTLGAGACGELPVEVTVVANFRKDYYLPDADYNEYTDTPLHGGRFQIATVAKVAGTVTKVLLNGQEITALEKVDPGVEWHHVWPHTLVANEPVWLSFHARDPAWDAATQGHLRIETTAGVAVDTDFPVQQVPVPLTWVTTDEARKVLLIHAHNTDSVPHTLKRIVVNARDQSAAAAVCAAETVVQPGVSALWQVALCQPWPLGAAWTVQVDFVDAPSAVGVGRVVPPRFGIETWPSSSDCVAPSASDKANFQRHWKAGFDTSYWYWGNNQCGFTIADMANDSTGASQGWQVLMGDDFPKGQPNLLKPDAAISGFLIGDESDAQVWDKKTGANNYAQKAGEADTLWDLYPQWPVYNGGMTNGNMGAFAGVADVQGIDLYIAACAPHVTEFGNAPPVRGAYDYLRNTRNNHMPLPTWQYAQGIFPGWNKGGGNVPVIHSQPSVAEIWIQGMSVLAAGGKGLMWFQTVMSEADYAPELWQAIVDVNWTFRGVRALVREGDLTGQATATHPQVLVEAIRARRAMVLPVLNFATDNVVDDVLCLSSFINDGKAPHWQFSQITTDIAVVIPRDLAVVEVFEVLAGKTVPLDASALASTRTLTLKGVQLGEAHATRLFVLAADKQVRAEVENALHP